MLDQESEKISLEVDVGHMIKNMSRTQIRKKVGKHSRKRGAWGVSGLARKPMARALRVVANSKRQA